jgi:hypothetical protein
MFHKCDIALTKSPLNAIKQLKIIGLDILVREWIQDLARNAGIEFIDLTSLVADRYQALGREKTSALFGGDTVHTNIAGADLNAASVVAGLKAIRQGTLFGKFLSEKGRAVEAGIRGGLSLPEPTNPLA